MQRLAAALSIFLVLLLLTLLSGLLGKKTAPRTGAIFSLLLFLSLTCCFLLWNAFLAMRLIQGHGLTTPRLLTAVLFAMPLPVFLGSSLLLPLMHLFSLKRRGIHPISSNDFYTETAAVAKELTAEMEIRRSVKVIFSEMNDFSPHVFGFVWGPTFLALPGNFEAMCRSATSGTTSSSLIRLVLAHELAHIKSRDLLWLPASWTWKHIFLPYALVVEIFLYRFFAAGDTELMYILKPTRGIVIAAALIIGLLLRMVVKAREDYADRCAAAYVPSSDLSQLLSDDKDGTSPFKRFLFSTVNWGASFLGFLGFTSRYRPLFFFDTASVLGNWNFNNSFKAYLSDSLARENKLKTLQYPFFEQWFSVLMNAIVAGIIAGVILEFGKLMKISLVTMEMFSKADLSERGWLYAFDILEEDRPVRLLIDFIVYFVTGLIAGTIMILPFRNKPVTMNENGWSLKTLKLLAPVVVCSFAFSITSGLINSRPSYPMMSSMRIMDLPCKLIIALVYLILLLMQQPKNKESI